MTIKEKETIIYTQSQTSFEGGMGVMMAPPAR